MTTFRITIDIPPDTESEARSYFDATSEFGDGANIRAVRVDGEVLWAVEVKNGIEGESLDQVQAIIDHLKQVEASQVKAAVPAAQIPS